MDTIVIFDPAPGPSSSAMAADTSAIYWYAPDSVQHSSGVITSWDDKTSNGYDLVQCGAANLPAYNIGGGYVEFDASNSEIIGITAFAHSNSTKAVLDGGGSVAIWVVCDPDMVAYLGQSTAANGTLLLEGPGGNTSQAIYCAVNTFDDPDTTSYLWINKNFSEAFEFNTPATGVSALTDTLALVKMQSDQSTSSGNINDGTYTNSVTPTTADFAASGDGLFVGATYNGGSPNGLFNGAIYEIFATSDTSTSNVNAIQAELVAKYGF